MGKKVLKILPFRLVIFPLILVFITAHSFCPQLCLLSNSYSLRFSFTKEKTSSLWLELVTGRLLVAGSWGVDVEIELIFISDFWKIVWFAPHLDTTPSYFSGALFLQLLSPFGAWWGELIYLIFYFPLIYHSEPASSSQNFVTFSLLSFLMYSCSCVFIYMLLRRKGGK